MAAQITMLMDMEPVENLMKQILALSKKEMLELYEWLSLHLEDQAELNPDFIARIERGTAELKGR